MSKSSSAGEVEREVQALRALVKRSAFSDAARTASVLLRELPENRDLLYLLAISQRHLKQLSEALQTLQILEQFHPRYSRLHQERGQCYVALKDAPRAIEAFRRAVSVNPALPTSWSMLEGLYRLIGDKVAMAGAAKEVARLGALPPPLLTATGLFADGDLGGAEKLVRAFLLQHGDHIEAMRLLARIGAALEVYDDAEFLLRSVLEHAPDYVAARQDYACVLLDRHKHVEAQIQLEMLLSKDPSNRDFRTLYATTVVGLGDHQRAITLYQDLLAGLEADAPEAAELHLSIAHSLKTLGRREESIAAYREAARARPNFGDAYWSLANLKTYRMTDQEIVQLTRAVEAADTSVVDRYHLLFALGKGFEDRQSYAQAFEYYQRGNALKRAESRYRPEVIELNTANQRLVCTQSFFSARSRSGVSSCEPIFIVGLPRSGSTLVEQILASHSQVEGTQELAHIPRLAIELQGREPDLDNPRYPRVLEQLPIDQFRIYAEQYLEETRVYRTNRPRFIDKMPNNFRHIGLIHLMFPNAIIIDARREPMACCFGNLKQLFARGQEFTYSIEDIARYYRTYLDLMEHWDVVLPRRVLRVRHEDVVNDLEGSIRRILGHCGLPFEDACMDFHKTERSVRTASSEQVRQPIYRDGLEQWKSFEPWLSTLRDQLGDALQRYQN